MPDDRKEIQEMLGTLPVPEASDRLENRIIEAAERESAAGENVQDMQAAIAQHDRRLYWQTHGPKFALAASFVAVLIMIADPVGKAGNYYLAQKTQERYTVDGVPLLADVEIEDEEFDYVYLDELL